jgi:hypothetical protein
MSSTEQERLQAIAAEMIAMSERDQAMRKSGQWDANVDVENTRRMQEIVEEIGWPTISKVGEHASHMAWLLVQHADHDRAFQKKCLELMRALPADEVQPSNIAYLEDRVRVGEGRPQLYGTQFYADEHGQFGPSPIEDPENVDQRRASVGLGTLAEYTQLMEKYRQPMPE